MMKSNKPWLSGLLLAAGLLSLAGCTQNSPPSAATASPFRLSASIQDIMDAVVDPAADALWDAVGSETTAAGLVEKQPKTDAEWLTTRHQAITLIEASNLLVIEGRKVVTPGKKLEDAHIPGVLTPEEAQTAMEKDRPRYIELAHGLEEAAQEALRAIDGKNPAALITAGGKIEHACEACHLKFWYPNAQRPPLEVRAK